MNNLELLRLKDDGVETLGTMAVIDENDATILKVSTLELPWKDNQHQVSCIPLGVYLCKKVPPSHIPYEHISIQNVQNRDGVCIHKANFVGELLGCVAVGMKVADINGDGEDDLSQSGVAFDKLMALMPNEFKLTIR